MTKTKPTRIAHVLWSLENGGLENLLVDLINKQVQEADVALIIINDRVYPPLLERLSPFCHIYFGKRIPGSKNPFFLLPLFWFINMRFRPQVIHFHMENGIERTIHSIQKIPILHTIHTIHEKRLSPQKFKHADCMVAISPAVETYLKQEKFKNVVRIDNGIEISSIRPRVYHIPTTMRIVQVSRLEHETKGQDLLLQALSLLKKKGVANFSLDFIGDGSSLEELKNIAVSLDLEKEVRFLGNQPRHYVYEHLADYDLFVQPSRWEGFGLTVAEAITARLPVLVSANQGPMDIIEQGKYGAYFPLNDAKSCASAIEELMKEYPTEDFLEEAAFHISKSYGMERVAQEYLQLYMRLMR